MEENSNITNFNLSMIANFFKKMPRQGPGCIKQTLKALKTIENLPFNAKIADIGCGTGAQTLVLAQNTDSIIFAIDFLPEMICGLNTRMRKYELENKVTGIVTSMTDMPFEEKELDLIWAEGSIYNIGFEKGYRDWQKLLKDGGYIVVSDACWISNKRPEDIDSFKTDFPEIDSIENKIKIIENSGYTLIDSFILPEYCWTTNYYSHMLKRIDDFLIEYKNSNEAKEFALKCQEEAEHYKQNKEYYGYVFFIAKKK